MNHKELQKSANCEQNDINPHLFKKKNKQTTKTTKAKLYWVSLSVGIIDWKKQKGGKCRERGQRKR